MNIYKLRIHKPAYIPAWCDSITLQRFCLPVCDLKPVKEPGGDVILSVRGGGERKVLIEKKNSLIYCYFDLYKTIESILKGGNSGKDFNLSSVLPENILKMFPGGMRKSYKKLIYFAAPRQEKKFPAWPYEDSFTIFIDLLLKLQIDIPFILPSFPLRKGNILITHDVDSDDGLKSSEKVLDLEKSLSIPATYFITGSCLKKNVCMPDRIVETGNEVGLHGITHSGNWVRKDIKYFSSKWDELKPVAERLGMKGFRSPYLARSHPAMKILENFFLYDSSIPDTSKLSPGAGISGCASIYPFYITARLIEVPITLPLDSSLLFLGYSPGRIIDIWRKKIHRIISQGGPAVLLTHTEKHFLLQPEMFDAYAKFLIELRNDSSLKFKRMSDVLPRK